MEESGKYNQDCDKIYCIDMYVVLLSPKSNQLSLYFNMKLVEHNFTIHDLKTQKRYCFKWHEEAGME